MLIHLDAGHDVNGNPRRCYVLILEINGYSSVAGAWNEGYKGCHAVPAEYVDQARRAVTIMTTASEYRSFLRQGTAVLKAVSHA